MFNNEMVVRTAYCRSLEADNAANPPEDSRVRRPLFWLALTPQRIQQLVLMLVLVGHSSYRAVQEILASALDYCLSLGSICNMVQEAAKRAAQINAQQDRLLLPAIAAGAHDEIFQGQSPALVGLDLASGYCYLLNGTAHRDLASCSEHLQRLDALGLKPDYTVADGGHALRLAQQTCWPAVPCHGDVFHAIRLLKRPCGSLERRALAAMQQAQELRQKRQRCWKTSEVARLSGQFLAAGQKADRLITLADDLRLLSQWMAEDVLSLKGPDPAVRRQLYDWIVQEIAQRAGDERLLREAARTLARQRETILGFACELQRQLERAAQAAGLPLYLLKRVYELEKGDQRNEAYWRQRSQLAHQLGEKLEQARRAVADALANTHRASSLVENLNSRIRCYFFLRRQVGSGPFLELLRFYFNHHVLGRSRCAGRRGSSPASLLGGAEHPHWLGMLGCGGGPLN